MRVNVSKVDSKVTQAERLIVRASIPQDTLYVTTVDGKAYMFNENRELICKVYNSNNWNGYSVHGELLAVFLFILIIFFIVIIIISTET